MVDACNVSEAERHGRRRDELMTVGAVGTVVFAVAAGAALIAPDIASVPFAVISSLLFAVGCVAFIWAYARSITRSRSEHVTVVGVYALSGSTPRNIQRRFHLFTAAQIVIAVGSAVMRPFTMQAFGILVPMFGLGLGGLWAARNGTFASRAQQGVTISSTASRTVPRTQRTPRKGSQRHG